MSDDFDKLRPPDDSDDDFPDWLSEDADASAARPSDSLGFTGELSWRQDVEKAFDDQLNQADNDFDWQTGQPETSVPSGSDDAAPDWLSSLGIEEPAQPETSAMPDWLSGADDLPSPSGEAASSEADLPDWLTSLGEPVAAAAAPPESAVPDWLDQPTPEENEPEVEVPDWLMGISEPVAAAAAPPESAVPDWLDQPAPEENEPEVEVPDWLMGIGEPAAAVPLTAPPGPESDLPDLFGDFEAMPEPAAADDLEDLFGDFEAAETPAEPAAVSARADDLEDLFGDLEAAEAAVPADDLFAQFETPAEPAAEVPADDLFAQFETPAEPARAPIPIDDLDALFGQDEAEPAVPAAPQPGASADIFAELGLPTPEFKEDYMQGFEQPEEEAQPDWFAAEPVANAAPNWLDELGDLTPEEPTPEAAPADLDLLSALRGAARPEEAEPALPDFDLEAPALQDIDSLLASYESAQPVESGGELLDMNADLERLLSDEDLEQIAAHRPGEPVEGMSPEAPDWLTELSELGASVGQASAAALVRKRTQDERPLEELPDRLKALHERGLELPTSSDDLSPGSLRQVLPGINQFIPEAPIKPGAIGITGDLILTDQQREKVNLLKTLVASEEAAPAIQRPSAIDLTYNEPNLADMLGEEEAEAPAPVLELEPEPSARPLRRRRRVRLDRLLIAALLTLAIVLPFLVADFRLGELPPVQFTANSRQQIAFERLDSLPADGLVLIAVEYGPTGAAELDSLTDALLRHVFMRGARPVVVSSNAVGLLHVQNLVEQIASDTAFLKEINRPALQPNRDYYISRFLAGAVIGLRAFTENLASALVTDINGQATQLRAGSLRDFTLIIVIAERAEEVRNWAEQAAPLARQPLLAAVSYSAAPLAEPYILAGSPGLLTGIQGMLIGYRDAYTYRSLLDARLFPQLALPAPTGLPPTEPTLEVTPTLPTVEATLPETPLPATAEGTLTSVPGLAGETVEPTATTEAVTATLVPSATLAAPSEMPTLTLTPMPTTTNTRQPTITPTPSPTSSPTFAPDVVITGVVNASQSINVRDGAGRTFAPIASLVPGATVRITGRNGDGSWFKILLDDGREGWVSAALITIQEPASDATPTPETGAVPDAYAVVGLISDVSFGPVFQATEATTPETTAEAPTATLAPSPTPLVAAGPLVTPYRDERWYGMTLGLFAIIIVIALGAVINVLRSLLRRDRR